MGVPVPVIESVVMRPDHVVVWTHVPDRMVRPRIYRMVDSDPTRLEVAD